MPCSLWSEHPGRLWYGSMSLAGGCSAGVGDVYYDIPKSFSAIEVRDLDGVLHKMSEYDGKVGKRPLDSLAWARG